MRLHEVSRVEGKFVPEVIKKDLEQASCGRFAIQNVHIRKVKIIKAPRFDMNQLMEFHDESTDVSTFLLSPCLLVLSINSPNVFDPTPLFSTGKRRQGWQDFREPKGLKTV